MALPALTDAALAIAAIVVGAVTVASTVRVLARLRHDRRNGSLWAVDRDRATELWSERYRLVGRPDAIRRLADGRFVPVEVKSRPAPVRGPPYSHRVQVWAYCLLVEEASGRSPGYGLLRYSDREFRVPWGAAEREELLELRRDLSRPYDGRARPSPARCAGCRWREGCDAAAAG